LTVAVRVIDVEISDAKEIVHAGGVTVDETAMTTLGSALLVLVGVTTAMYVLCVSFGVVV